MVDVVGGCTRRWIMEGGFAGWLVGGDSLGTRWEVSVVVGGSGRRGRGREGSLRLKGKKGMKKGFGGNRYGDCGTGGFAFGGDSVALGG